MSTKNKRYIVKEITHEQLDCSRNVPIFGSALLIGSGYSMHAYTLCVEEMCRYDWHLHHHRTVVYGGCDGCSSFVTEYLFGFRPPSRSTLRSSSSRYKAFLHPIGHLRSVKYLYTCVLSMIGYPMNAEMNHCNSLSTIFSYFHPHQSLPCPFRNLQERLCIACGRSISYVAQSSELSSLTFGL